LSKNFKVLVCDPVHEVGLKMLTESGFTVDFKPEINSNELKKVVGEYHALIVRGRTKISKDILAAAENLKIIVRAGVGLDNIDLAAAEDLGITVVNTPKALTEAVAELTIGLMLSLARMIPYADRNMKEGKWSKKELMGWELKGKTLGIVGFGRVGMRVADIAKVFGMRIIVHTRRPEIKPLDKYDAVALPLHEMLMKSDIVSLHVTLTPQTRHMISEEEFKAMKDGIYLINTSRGAIVDEKALLEALKSGKIAGAALDVYEVEPPTNMELIRMPNVICTPHIGAQTVEAQKTASIMAAEKIISFFKVNHPR